MRPAVVITCVGAAVEERDNRRLRASLQQLEARAARNVKAFVTGSFTQRLRLRAFTLAAGWRATCLLLAMEARGDGRVSLEEVQKGLAEAHADLSAASDPFWLRGDDAGASLRLVQAAGAGACSGVKVLLRDEHVDPTAYGFGALRLAAYMGHVDSVRVLLGACRAGTDRELTAAGMHDALVAACFGGHAAAVATLLEDARARPSHVELLVAATHGFADTARVLLRDRRLRACAPDINVVLLGAALNGDGEVTRLLLEAEPAAVDPNAYDGAALALAVYGEHLDTVRALLSDGRLNPKHVLRLAWDTAQRVDRASNAMRTLLAEFAPCVAALEAPVDYATYQSAVLTSTHALNGALETQRQQKHALEQLTRLTVQDSDAGAAAGGDAGAGGTGGEDTADSAPVARALAGALEAALVDVNPVDTAPASATGKRKRSAP